MYDSEGVVGWGACLGAPVGTGVLLYWGRFGWLGVWCWVVVVYCLGFICFGGVLLLWGG
jgi:hypothetical protein